jgi:hypothetical protein
LCYFKFITASVQELTPQKKKERKKKEHLSSFSFLGTDSFVLIVLKQKVQVSIMPNERFNRHNHKSATEEGSRTFLGNEQIDGKAS